MDKIIKTLVITAFLANSEHHISVSRRERIGDLDCY